MIISRGLIATIPRCDITTVNKPRIGYTIPFRIPQHFIVSARTAMVPTKIRADYPATITDIDDLSDTATVRVELFSISMRTMRKALLL